MKTHKNRGPAPAGPRRFFALILSLLILGAGLPAQPPSSPIPAPENILAGALIIPMDNFHQGNAAQTTFNVRAYGLANLLLQNDIPVKWAIKPGKSKDATDFSANVTRIAGAQGVAGPATANFAGGPFIVTREYDTAAVRGLISSFNTAGGAGNEVTVYKTNADAAIDVRYTLNFRPKIAIGPDGGGFGAGVHQRVFNRAGITNFTSVSEDITTEGNCFTLATQAHSENNGFVNVYREFVEGGGNLLLQCRSIITFENDPAGHFQTTALGYSIYGTTPNTGAVTTTLSYPSGATPFNQFIGYLADQTGAVTEYSYAPGGGPAHGNAVSVVNTGADADKFVATVSKFSGANAAGGVVFELGGHEYMRPDANEVDTPLSMINGDRMVLNTAFVPAQSICSRPPDAVIGYKSVRPITNRVGGPRLLPGEVAEWTIDYINNSQVNQFDFQVRDVIGEVNGKLTYVPGSLVVTPFNPPNPSAEVTIASANAAYDGVGDDATADQLAAGGYLPVGGRIQIKVRTLVDNFIVPPGGYILFNQTRARSASIVVSDLTKSDAIDATNTSIFGVPPPPPDSVQQPQNVNQIDPTRVPLVPTAGEAAIEGRIVNEAGGGISGVVLKVVSASTGETRTIRTNAFGVFRIADLQVGGVYLLTASHKRYRFPEEPVSVSLSDNVTGLTIVGQVPNGKGSIKAAVTPARGTR